MSEPMSQVADQLEAFTGTLQGMVAGLPQAALTHRPGPEEWSIVEVVGHLEDVDALMMGRIERALTEDRPELPVYEEKGPVKERNFQAQPFAQVLEAFLARRAAFVALLRRLTPAELERFGVHPMHGELSVDRIPRSLPRHDETHRGQIAGNLEHYAARAAVAQA
jgi:uncharacterized damage-inducible protein DinB